MHQLREERTSHTGMHNSTQASDSLVCSGPLFTFSAALAPKRWVRGWHTQSALECYSECL